MTRAASVLTAPATSRSLALRPYQEAGLAAIANERMTRWFAKQAWRRARR
jgi:hypothetical protein